MLPSGVFQVRENFLDVMHHKQEYLENKLFTNLLGKVRETMNRFVQTWAGQLPDSVINGLNKAKGDTSRKAAERLRAPITVSDPAVRLLGPVHARVSCVPYTP